MKRYLSLVAVLALLVACVPAFAGGHCVVNVAKVQAVAVAQPVAVPVAVQQYAAPVQAQVFQQSVVAAPVVSANVYAAPTFTVQTALPVLVQSSGYCSDGCAVNSGAVVQVNSVRSFSAGRNQAAGRVKVKKVKVR